MLDKSTLQSLSQREAFWLSHLFRVIVTTPLRIEILGNLYKAHRDGRDPERFVASLAEKLTHLGVYNTPDHAEMAVQAMLGNPVPMDGRIPLSGGKVIRDRLGRKGMFFDETDDDRALRRWSAGQFTDEERAAATAWQQLKTDFDMEALAARWRKLLPEVPPNSSLDQLVTAAIRSAQGNGEFFRIVKYACHEFRASPEEVVVINARARAWKRERRLDDFAPYAHFALSVHLFTYAGLSSGTVGPKFSNIPDINYFCFAPFCHALVSGDEFVLNAGRAFLRKDQLAVQGPKLKAALNELEQQWLAEPEEVRHRGTARWLRYPRPEGLIAAIWDRAIGTRWRERASQPEREMTKEETEALLREIRPFKEAIDSLERNEDALGKKPLKS